MEIKPFFDYIKQYIELTEEEESIILSRVSISSPKIRPFEIGDIL